MAVVDSQPKILGRPPLSAGPAWLLQFDDDGKPVLSAIQGVWQHYFSGQYTFIRSLQDLQVFADNAAAKAGGLSIGNFYRVGGDPDLVAVVH